MSLFIKIFKYIFLFSLSALFITIISIVLKGVYIYNSSIHTTSIELKIEEIRQKEDYVEYDEISPFFLNALIAVEDHRFYTHKGIDFLLISKVMWGNIKNMCIVGGGSTITQQLARNFYFTQEKKFSRKVAEALIAVDIEESYSKETIIELYLNIIYFGNGLYGIGDACEYYFNASPYNITKEQSLYLAGIPQAPSVYSADKTKAEQRANQVYKAMVDFGYIS